MDNNDMNSAFPGADATPDNSVPPAGPTTPMATQSPTAQAATSAPPPAVGSPGTPHAGLINMLQGMFLGMDAFAKAAATGGREGGVGEVLQARNQAADLKMKQDEAQREEKESAVRIQHTQALTNGTIAQTQILMHEAPLRYQQLVMDNQKSMADLLINTLHVPAAFAVPMIQGQSTDEHMSAVNNKAGGDLVNNTVIPVHSDSFSGGGMSYGLNFDKLKQVNLDATQAAPTLANLQNQIDLAKGYLGPNDASVQAAQGKLDLMKKSSSVNGWDFYIFNQQVQAQLMSKVANKQQLTQMQTQQTDLQEKQQRLEAASRPKNLDDAQSRATQAQLAYQKNPTPQTKEALNDANAQLQNFKRLDVSKAYADASARVQAARAADEDDLTLVAKEVIKPDNLTALKDVASMRGDQRLRLYAIAKRLDPNFDPGQTNRKIRFVEQFTNPNGKTMQNIASYNTFLQHAADASAVVGQYRTTNLPLINTPLNKIRGSFGDAAYTQMEAALAPAREEYINFLKAGFAPHESDVKMGEQIASGNATPAQIEVALKQMAHTAVRRSDSINEQYRANMGQDYPDLITPAAKDAAAKLGLGDLVSKYGSGGRVDRRSSAQQSAPAGLSPAAQSYLNKITGKK